MGRLTEALKWWEPAYLTAQTKSGSTVRVDWKERTPGQYSLYFICTTNLVESFQTRHPGTFSYEGSRAIVFDADAEIPERQLRDCFALALTYHLKGRGKPKASRGA